MNFNKKLAVAVSGAVLLMAGQVALADSATDIVDALVMKGVLTEEEGRLITKGHTSKTNVTPVLKEKDNNFTIESPNGNNSIGLTGRIHFDYRNYDYNQGNHAATAASSTGADTFDMRRARLGVKYKFAKYYSGEIVFNTVGVTDVLDVAFLDINWVEKAKIRVGQFKMPMSLEQLTSSNNIDFIERSVLDNYVAAKERGVQVFGEPATGLTYAVALSNGNAAANQTTGPEGDNKVDNKDVLGRFTINFAEIMGNKEMVLHAGLALARGEIPYGTGFSASTSAPRTEARGASYFTAPTLLTTTASDKAIDRTRVGLEGIIAQGPFKLQAQYLKTNFDFSTITRGYDADINTWYAEALWTLTGETHASRYKAGAFGGIKPTKNFDADTFSGGAWEIGARYSRIDAKDFNTEGLATGKGTLETAISGTGGVAASGFTTANAYTAGVKFVANPNFRVMLDYVHTNWADPINNVTGINVNGRLETKENAVLMRTQVMF
jgi:phosphate-selective porin OprO/OprP